MAATINISLPEPLKAYVDAQTETGPFSTADEYISDLIANDRERHRRSVEERLLDSLKQKSEAIEIPEEILERGDIAGFLEERANRLRWNRNNG